MAPPIDPRELHSRASPVGLKIARLGKAVVHEKSDTLSAIVDAVDCGRADPLWIIDRVEESIIEDGVANVCRNVRNKTSLGQMTTIELLDTRREPVPVARIADQEHRRSAGGRRRRLRQHVVALRVTVFGSRDSSR